jgi:hypothetical protein
MNVYKAALGALVGLALTAQPALAGPTFKFGPEEQGALKLDYKAQFQLRMRDTGAGADADGAAAEFNFRRNRIALMGSWSDSFSLYVQTEFLEDNNLGSMAVGDGEAAGFQMLDAALRFKLHPSVNVWAGKFKYGFTRENLEACESPLTLDRSVLIRAPFVSTRDLGVSVWGNLLDGLVQYRVDAMNGRNDSASSPASQLRYTARVHASLLDAEKEYGYKGTYLGKKKVLTVGAAYQHEGGVAYADAANADGSVDYNAWTVDLFAEVPVAGLGTFTASAAFADYDLDGAYQGADPEAATFGLNGEKNGWYAKAAWMLPVMPLQLFARAERWSFAQLDGFYDQEVGWYGLGANYYARGQDLKLTAEYAMTDFDQEGTVGGVTTQDANTFIVQLQVVF